ncbi:dipeptidyl aminopeptidase-like protein 6 [Dreissena polymorpha]|nr:dipeptidyl aminopeptidase-like protein 6 [Dreissena polymorpha]
MSTYARLSNVTSTSWQEPEDPARHLRVEELIVEEKEAKNWAGIILSVVVIVIIISAVVLTVFLVTPDPAIEIVGDKLSVDDYADGSYQAFKLEVTWSAEELLRSDSMMWLSPDDSYLVYVENDVTSVPSINMIEFGDSSNAYHGLKNFRTSYVTSVTWFNDVTFAVAWLHPRQNESVICVCVAKTGYCYDNLWLTAATGWIDPVTHLLPTSNGEEYFLVTPRPNGAGDSINSVALVDASVDITATGIDGRMIFVTVKDVEVERIVGYSNQSVYFLGIPLKNSTQRQLYSVYVNKAVHSFRQLTCVTCNVNSDCLYVDADFSPHGQYYVLECLGPGVPSYSVYATPDSHVKTLEDNWQLRAHLEGKLVPWYKFFNITLPDKSYLLAKAIMPPKLNIEEDIKYNVIIVPNSGIGQHTVTSKFELDWLQVLVSKRSVIVVTIDTSGSRGRGEAWLKAVRGNLGAREQDEVLASMRYFRQLHYVNENMGIMGKDYGGFVILRATSADLNDVFTCGVAISPVVNFPLMNVVFNDKYLASEGYSILQEPPLFQHVANMKNHSVFLLHGMLDNRVHFQHTAQYIKALVAAGVAHRQQIYPDVRDLFDVRSKSHVVTSVEGFYTQCLGLDPNADPDVVLVEEEDD